ncbi:hypothetical protein [Desulfopila sp. IMCC35008]|nr:hypothetical protein [Desulfopila sp. IMCC35008]
MHMQLLDPDYLAWDQSATIEFLRPGTGKLATDFHLKSVNQKTKP